MANKPAGIDLDNSFTVVPQTPQAGGGGINLDDSFDLVNTPQGASDIVPMQGTPIEGAHQTLPASNPLDVYKQELEKTGWGISPELRHQLGGDVDAGILSGVVHAPAHIADAGAKALQALQAGTETGLHYIDKAADSTGLADLLSFDGNKFHPGEALGALMEAFPLGGLEVGGLKVTPAGVRNADPRLPIPEDVPHTTSLSADADAAFQSALRKGDDVGAAKILSDNGGTVDQTTWDQIQSAVDYYKKGGTEKTSYQARPSEGQAQLEAEAKAFKSQSEPTEADLWPTEEDKARRLQAVEDKLQAEVSAWKNRTDGVELDDSFTPEPKSVPEADKISKVKEVSDEVDKVRSDWKNSPDIEVVHSVDDIADPQIRKAAQTDGADGALGFLGPDGKVRIIAENITDKADVPALVFHEALGHFGLAQRFGEDVDALLNKFYEESVGGFKKSVDDWLENNPDAYKNYPNRHLRAAEEVLAEMSQNGGPIVNTFVDNLLNKVKDYARQMGIQLKYSDREIKTILGMAHDAVINGHGSDVVANGFRFHNPEVSRREQIKNATTDLEQNTKPGETRSVQPFPEQEPDYFRFRHLTEDGKVVSGYYTVGDGKIDNFSVSSEGGPRSIGPKTIRKIGRDLLDRHPEANSVAGYRISGARPEADFVDSGNRFMNRKQAEELRSRRESGEDPSTRVGRVNIENIATVHDVDSLLQSLAENTPKVTRTFAEAKQKARDLNLNPNKVAKGKGVGHLDAMITGYRQVQTNLLDRMAELHQRMDEGQFTDADQQNYITKLAQLNLVHARVQNDVSEIARALNAMKILSVSNKRTSAILSELAKSGGNMAALADRDTFLRFAKSIQQHLEDGNPEGAGALATKILKPYWEDYILTGRHAAMLSAVGTHYKNVVENAAFVVRDLQEHGLAMVGGNVTPTEMKARLYGLMRATIDSVAYRQDSALRDAVSELKKGPGNREVSSKVEIENARIPGASKVLDALHAEDTLFRGFLDNMNLYGLGVREAQKQGLTGTQAFQQGSYLALNPTEAMLEQAKKAADRALLVDKPTKLTTMVEAAKARSVDMSAADRTLRFASHLLFPFARVSDRIIARKLTRSPLALTSRQFWNDIKSGDKAVRDVAISRTLMGTALIGYYVWAANKGDVEGGGPGYKKQQAFEAGGYLPNSVKEEGQYKDASTTTVNFYPLSLHNSAATDVASLVQAYHRGALSGEGYVKGIKQVLGSVVTILGNGSFADNIQPALDVYSAVKGAGENEGKADAAVGSFAAGLASSFVPNAIRTANTSLIDTKRRDSSGDKSITDRVKGRVMAGVPGLSQKLPVKYDVYGQEMEQGKNLSGVDNYQNIKTEPAVVELQRLERTQKEALVTAAPNHFKVDGKDIKLTGKDYAEYQRVSGWYFLEGMKKVVEADGWKSADDQTKKLAVKELLKEARVAAKDYLYPGKDTK